MMQIDSDARSARADDRSAVRAANRRVIVALELDRPESAKVEVAVAQARALGASLTLLHVVTGTSAVAEARARAEIAALARRLREAGVEVETAIRRGAVAPTIIAEIERTDTALAVLGSSIRRTLARPALGGITERVVRAISRPVLLVRSSEAAVGNNRAA